MKLISFKDFYYVLQKKKKNFHKHQKQSQKGKKQKKKNYTKQFYTCLKNISFT